MHENPEGDLQGIKGRKHDDIPKTEQNMESKQGNDTQVQLIRARRAIRAGGRRTSEKQDMTHKERTPNRKPQMRPRTVSWFVPQLSEPPGRCDLPSHPYIWNENSIITCKVKVCSLKIDAIWFMITHSEQLQVWFMLQP